MADETLAAPLSEAAQIAIAYLGNPSNPVLPGDVGLVLAGIYHAVDVAHEVVAEHPHHAPQPAVPVEESVGPDFLICLEDGQKLKMLKRYLRTQHGMSPEEYREKWSLPADYPMVAPDYSTQRSALAKEQGLGRKAAPKLVLPRRTAAN